jgi:3',5'-nucleoside bisphosphate phosphatase
MNDFRADLHCHSTCSDGTSTPQEVVQLAKSIGLSGLSITDHDTIDAYTEAMPAAKEAGIELIPGVEFSCTHDGSSVHIIAYAFPLENKLIQDFCLKHKESRTKRNKEILRLLNLQKIAISEEDVMAVISSNQSQERRVIGRPHIALAMMKKGYVSTIKEAFQKYLGEGKSCYASRNSFPVEDTIKLIHEAKGLAVIAHPHLINDTAVLKALLAMPFDGLECYYARFNADVSKRWLKIAEHRNWFVTGGSDYHGDIKPNNPLGSSWIDNERFEILRQHFRSVCPITKHF